MKSISTAYKQIWMVKVFPRNTKCTCSTTWKNLSGIDTYENIHLIQAGIYHAYCKLSSKGH